MFSFFLRAAHPHVGNKKAMGVVEEERGAPREVSVWALEPPPRRGCRRTVLAPVRVRTHSEPAGQLVEVLSTEPGE